MMGLGEAVDQFAAATSQAGGAYRQADQAAIPIGAVGASGASADAAGGGAQP